MKCRRIALAVFMLVGMAVGGAGHVSSGRYRAGKIDDSILATIFDLFGITLDSKVGIPPG